MNDADLAIHLRKLEEELLRPQVRRSANLLSILLADDFREFGTSGRVCDKPSILAALATEESAELSLTDFACQRLSPEIALVTYRSRRTDNTGSRDALRSSLWIHRDGRWQILFHQGTRI